jgi:hypothetical protein
VGWGRPRRENRARRPSGPTGRAWGVQTTRRTATIGRCSLHR